MTRLRPVHRLTKYEAALATAIAPAHECEALRRAKRLKQAIEEFWNERGQAIEVRIVEAQIANRLNDTQTHRAYLLTSNTINGLPAAQGAAP